MNKEIIKQLVLEQQELFNQKERIIKRPLQENILKSKKIIVITGVRRCGKSTLLKQISKKYHSFFYFNFEDERLLDFTRHDFNTLLEVFLELNSKVKTFFFDEIQEITGWEKFARRLFTNNYKLFITGSNAKLLSSEIATSLTGRNLKIELFPFSFKEFIQFKKIPLKDTYQTKEKAKISSLFEEYFNLGGFPEVAITKDKQELIEIYQDVLIKDILVRFRIKDSKEFRELSLFLISNISKRVSFNNIKNLLKFSNTSKVKNYMDFLTQAYLFFPLFLYNSSVKRQIINKRKIYAIDTGIINSIAFQTSKNAGSILENIVFLELKRKQKDIFYYSDKKECDFVIRTGTKITHAIQVSYEMSNPKTRQREIEGLMEALDRFNLNSGFIITKSEEKTIEYEEKKIKIIPITKFLMFGLENN